MIKGLLNLVLLFFCMINYAQPNLVPCIASSSENFELKLLVKDSYDFTCYLSNYAQNKNYRASDVSFCDPFLADYIDDINGFIVNESTAGIIDSLIIYSDRIHSLKIEILIQDNLVEISDLSKLDFLKVVHLPNLKEIEIKAPNKTFGNEFKIKFSKWNFYNVLLEKKGLISFKVSGFYSDKNLIDAIKPFSNLKELKLPESLNYDLLSFKELESVELSNQRYFFSNYLTELPDLNYYGNNTKRLEPGVYEFYLNNLNALSNPESFSSKILPVEFIDSLMDQMIPEKLSGTGNVVLLCEDIKKHCLSDSGLDTLAIGKVVNGEKSGVWTFYPMIKKSNTQYTFEYHHNYSSNEQIAFPLNGIWNYYHFNGVLAIEGRFKNGKKDGLWNFYDRQAELTAIKTFEQDQPKGLFIEYYKYPEKERFSEQRTYYYDLNNWVEVSILNDSSLFFRSSYVTGKNRKFFHISRNGDLNVIRKNKEKNKKIDQNSKKYNSLFYKHCIHLLFPEFKKGECPYVNRINKN